MSGDEIVDHECETGVAPTELGGAIVETGPQLAYSEELPALDYPEPVSRVRVALIAGGIVASAAVVVGVVLLVGHSRRAEPTPVAATPTITTTASPIAAPPPPPPPPPVTITTVIVQSTIAQKTSPPPQSTAIPAWLAEYDRKFVAQLYSEGWRGGDPKIMAHNAHLVCARLSNGVPIDSINQELATVGDMDMTSALLFSSLAMITYPNCR